MDPGVGTDTVIACSRRDATVPDENLDPFRVIATSCPTRHFATQTVALFERRVVEKLSFDLELREDGGGFSGDAESRGGVDAVGDDFDVIDGFTFGFVNSINSGAAKGEVFGNSSGSGGGFKKLG